MELAELFAELLADVLAEILTADVLVELAGGTELVRMELVGTELVAELVVELEARVEVRQLKALEVLLVAVHC